MEPLSPFANLSNVPLNLDQFMAYSKSVFVMYSHICLDESSAGELNSFAHAVKDLNEKSIIFFNNLLQKESENKLNSNNWSVLFDIKAQISSAMQLGKEKLENSFSGDEVVASLLNGMTSFNDIQNRIDQSVQLLFRPDAKVETFASDPEQQLMDRLFMLDKFNLAFAEDLQQNPEATYDNLQEIYILGVVDYFTSQLASTNISAPESVEDLLNECRFNQHLKKSIQNFAAFHLACLKMKHGGVEFCDLPEAYSILNSLLKEKDLLPNHLTIIKLKLAEAIYFSMKYSKRYGSRLDEFRKILLSIITDPSIPVIYKIEANFQLAFSYIDIKNPSDKYFMAQKSLRYILENADPSSIYLPLAQVHLGFMLILGYPGVTMSLEQGRMCIENALKSKSLSSKVLKSCELLNNALQSIEPILATQKSNNPNNSPAVENSRIKFIFFLEQFLKDKPEESFSLFAENSINIFSLFEKSKLNKNMKLDRSDSELINSDLFNFLYKSELDPVSFDLHRQNAAHLLMLTAQAAQKEDDFEKCYNILSQYHQFRIKKLYEEFTLSVCRVDELVFGVMADQENKPALILQGLDIEKIFTAVSNQKSVTNKTLFLHFLFTVVSSQMQKISGMSISVDSRSIRDCGQGIMQRFYDLKAVLERFSFDESNFFLYFCEKWMNLAEVAVRQYEKVTDQFSSKMLSNYKIQQKFIDVIEIQKMYLEVSRLSQLDENYFLSDASGDYTIEGYFFRYKQLVSILPYHAKKPMLRKIGEYSLNKYFIFKSCDPKKALQFLARGLKHYYSSISLDCLNRLINKSYSKNLRYEDILDIDVRLEEIGMMMQAVGDPLSIMEFFINQFDAKPEEVALLSFLEFMYIAIEYKKFEGNEETAELLIRKLEAFILNNKLNIKISQKGAQLSLDHIGNMIDPEDLNYLSDNKFCLYSKALPMQQALIQSLAPESNSFQDFVFAFSPLSANAVFVPVQKNCTSTTIVNPALKASSVSGDPFQNEEHSSSSKLESQRNAKEILAKKLRKKELHDERKKSEKPFEHKAEVKSCEPKASPKLRVKIPGSAMETFKQLFVYKKGCKKRESGFDSTDFANNLSISRNKIAQLIAALGGKYISGKGSHTKGILPWLEHSDKIVLDGETMTFAHFNCLENLNQDSTTTRLKGQAPQSQTVILTNDDYLLHYQIIQLRRKLLVLGYNPDTVFQG